MRLLQADSIWFFLQAPLVTSHCRPSFVAAASRLRTFSARADKAGRSSDAALCLTHMSKES